MVGRCHCPFCNATNAMTSMPDGPRITCVRCGETFVATDGEGIPADPNPPAAIAVEKRSRPGLYASLAAAALLAVGLFVVVRPWESPPVPEPAPDPRPAATVPPAALAGLAFVPASANIVVAVQPAALLAYAERTRTDPAELLAKAGVPAQVLATLAQAGVPLNQIDHLVAGVTLANDSLVPGLTLVLKLRQPLKDEAKFLQKIRAEHKPLAGRPIYTTNLSSLLMTKVDAATYLFGLTDKDFDTADHPAAASGQHLAGAVRESLADRLSPASFAWLVTDRSADWAKKPTLMLAVKKEQLAKLVRGRSLAVGLSLEPDPRLRIAVDVENDVAGAELRETAKGKLPGATVGGEGAWATADMPVDLTKGVEALRGW